MPAMPYSRAAAKLVRRWPRRVLSAAALTAAAVPAALAGAGPAAAATPSEPPPVTVLTVGADNHNGDIFITPTGDASTYANGPEIINNKGQVIWFHAIPAGQTASDFRKSSEAGQSIKLLQLFDRAEYGLFEVSRDGVSA